MRVSNIFIRGPKVARIGEGMVRSITVPGPGQNIAQIGRLIPAPAAPVEPVLSIRAFLPAPSQPIGSVLDTGPAIKLTAGRYAIALALNLMGLQKGDNVLIPAFHCSSMVEPLSIVGADPVFYRLKKDLTLDLTDIEAKISSSTKCIMATHYFGFPQSILELRDLCDRTGIKLLEDCAHGFFGNFDNHRVGSLGDYVIASPRKFFPAPDGGYLFQRNNLNNEVRLLSGASLLQSKMAFNFVEHSVKYGRLWLFAPIVKAANFVKNILGKGLSKPTLEVSSASTPNKDPDAYGNFDISRLNSKMTLFSRLICSCTAKGRIIKSRRDNYLKLLQGLEGLQCCHPLFPVLPVGVVPHMFPLWVDDLDAVFPKLEDLAIPMQRFGQFLSPGIDETMCSTSSGMSHHLVQFPCHQELSAQEIDWMISSIQSVFVPNNPV